MREELLERRFAVLGIEGLFAAKAALLARRVRSRDLFDLKAMLDRHGYSMRLGRPLAKRLNGAGGVK